MMLYRVHGLTFDSQLELPELRAVADRPVDVTVRLAPLAVRGPRLTPLPGGAGFEVAGVARFAVLGGREVLVDPAPGADPRNVRLFLLGSAMGLLLHQLGLLPLHANSVVIDGQAILLMGASGAGKSTLAAWFYDRGYSVLGDDVAVVRMDGRGASVAPGPPRLRLCLDSLRHSGRDEAGHQPSFVGHATFSKFELPIDERESDLVPVAGIYAIEDGDALDIAALAGMPAVETLFAHTYRGGFVAAADSARSHWQASLALLARIPLFRLRREQRFDRLDALGEALIAHHAGSRRSAAG